jgi:hypothetical protein
MSVLVCTSRLHKNRRPSHPAAEKNLHVSGSSSRSGVRVYINPHIELCDHISPAGANELNKKQQQQQQERKQREHISLFLLPCV